MATAAASKVVPSFNADVFVAAQKRNLDAFTSAAQIVADGLRVLAKRQAEIAEASVREFVTTGEAFFKAPTTPAQPADMVAKLKTAYEKNVANAQELAGIVAKAQTDAANVLSTAALANLDDLKKIAA